MYHVLDTNSGSFLPIPVGKIQLPSKSGSLILTSRPVFLENLATEILLRFLGVTLCRAEMAIFAIRA